MCVYVGGESLISHIFIIQFLIMSIVSHVHVYVCLCVCVCVIFGLWKEHKSLNLYCYPLKWGWDQDKASLGCETMDAV